MINFICHFILSLIFIAPLAHNFFYNLAAMSWQNIQTANEQCQLMNNVDKWNQFKINTLIEQDNKNLTEQIKENLTHIDPTIFIGCLQNLNSNLNISLSSETDIETLLSMLIEHEMFKASDVNKKYLFSQFIKTAADFFKTQPQNTDFNTAALTLQLQQIFKDSIENIKNAPTTNNNCSFFKKKYLLLTVFILFVLTAIIILGITINNNRKKAALEKKQHHEAIIGTISQELTDTFKKQIRETQENTHVTLATIQESAEELDKEIEAEKIPNVQQIDTLSQNINALESQLKSAVKEYEEAKKVFARQQETFDKVLQHGNKGVAITKWQQDSAVEELRQKLDTLNKLKEKLKQKRSWLDDLFENFSLDDASSAIDTANKGLNVFETGFGFLKKIFGFGAPPKQETLSERLEKLEDSGFAIKIPTRQPKRGTT